MPQSAPKAFTVLDRAKSESYSEKDAETFKRVENRMAKKNQAKLVGKMASYRREGADMNLFQLLNEKHSSSLLGKHLRTSGIARPGAKWEAHHLISGKHAEAADARLVLAEESNKIRIDDPDNGAWMPKTKADARPTMYPNAIGHNRIHRQLYYFWIGNAISMMDDDLQIRAFLNTVRAQLLHGNIRDEMKLQQDIDEAEYKDWLKMNRKI
jgi:hypothetical protein